MGRALAPHAGPGRADEVLDVAPPARSIMIVFALVIRTAEFLFYHLLLSAVDRVSRLPRDTTIPEAMRLYRENIALKAQLDLLCRRLALYEGKFGKKPIDVRRMGRRLDVVSPANYLVIHVLPRRLLDAP